MLNGTKILFISILFFLPFRVTRAEISAEILFNLENLCGKDHYESCGQLGIYFRDEVKDPKRAIPFYEKACSGGRSGSCMHLSSLYTSVIPDLEKRLVFAEKACSLGEPLGCVMAGLTLANDYKDEKSSEKYLKLGCEGNNGTGCHFLGEYYETESQQVTTFLPLAQEAFKKACDLNIDESCKKLGIIKEKLIEKKECFNQRSQVEKKCEKRDCSEEISSLIGKSCFPDEQQLWDIVERNCLKFKSNSCHEVAGMYFLQNKFTDAMRFSEWSCKNGNHYSCSINKYSRAMISDDKETALKVLEELESGCFDKRLFGDCDLAFDLRNNKKIQTIANLDELTIKGCDLGSPYLCFEQARSTSEKVKKIKYFERACNLGNQKGCVEAGRLLKVGSFFDRIEAIHLLRGGCEGHRLDNPIEYGCGDLTILEAEFHNLIPSSKTFKLVGLFSVAIFLFTYVFVIIRKRTRDLKTLAEKTSALEGEFNKKRKEEIMEALDRIE